MWWHAGQFSRVEPPVILSYSAAAYKLKAICQVKVYTDAGATTEVQMRRPMWGGRFVLVPNAGQQN